MRAARSRILLQVVLLLLTVVMAFPFFYLMKLSLQPDADIFQVPIRFVPSAVIPANYVRVMDLFPLVRQFWNSVIYAAFTTVFTIMTGAAAAYALAKLRLPGARIITLFFIATMLLPPEIRAIPMYTMMARFGWVDTWNGMIVPLSTTGFSIFFIYQFMITMPDELFEAARIDGASERRLFWMIALPLSQTAISTMALYNFLFRWRGFIWPLVMTRGTVTTLSVGLSALKTGEGLMQWNLVGAATMFLFLPSLALFIGLRRFVLGAVAYSIK